MSQYRKQTLSGYIREHLDELETRFELGVRQQVIVNELRGKGYESCTVSSFGNRLAEARKWKRAKIAMEAAEPVCNRSQGHRQGAGITKAAIQPVTGRIRNPGNIDESEVL